MDADRALALVPSRKINKSRKENYIRDQKLRGKEHVNHVGNYVAARTIGPDCNCKRLQCFKAVSAVNREKIFKHFYQISSKDLQDSYLAGLICVEEVKQRRRRRPPHTADSASGESARTKGATGAHPESHSASADSSSDSDICKFSHTASVFYKVRLRNAKGVLVDVQVCREAFISIHGITTARVRRIYNALMTTGYIPVDSRGKYKNRPNMFPEPIKNLVRCHIMSFEPKPCNKDNPSRTFLSDSLSIRKMHRMFWNEYYIQVSYRDYWNIFTTDFNIKFGSPGAKPRQTAAKSLRKQFDAQ